MSAQYLMGLDAGGGAGRCLLVDVETGRATSAARAWTHAPLPGGWGFDLDTDTCWRLLSEAVHEAMQRGGVEPGQVLGVAVTSMRHGLVVIDGAGRVLLAAPNRDARAATEGMELGQDRGPALYARTGHWPMPTMMAARLLWMAGHQPDLLRRAAAALSISDWFAYRLCGEAATDYSQAGETLLLDIGTREWAWDLVDELALPRAILPPLLQAGTALGKVSAEAAAGLGLLAGTPVVTGGGDTQCGLLGVGAVRPGDLAAIAGTTVPVQAVVDRPLVDPSRHLWTGLHVLPGCWVLESNAGNVGEGLEWFARLLYPDSPHAVAHLLAEAGTAPPGAGGLFSTLGGQVFDASQMGVPVGNLTLFYMGAAGRRADLARAVAEGTAFTLRANIEQIVALSRPPTEVRLAGGLSRSAVWSRMVGDVLNLPVAVSHTPESTALGAAICAGVGVGAFRDLAEGAARLAQMRGYVPNAANARLYADIYADWQKLRQARAPADDLAADIFLQQVGSEPAGVESAPPAGFRPRFLVTAQLDEAGLAALRELGDVTYANYREALQVLTGDDLVEALQGVQAFVTEVDVVDLEALQRLPDLRVVVSCRGNAVNVDTAACTALGVPVLNAPGRNADAVADLAVAFMLMLGRRLAPASAFLRQPGGEAGDMGRMGQAYGEFLGRELWGKTVGLVGLGAVGRGVAQRLRPFSVRLLVHDPYVQPEDASLVDGELVSLERLLAESDFVSLHAAVTEGTRGLIGAAALGQMKQGAFLVNTARAALVDEDALLEHLRSGHLGGAALDVFSVEPPAASHPLLALPNVVATPHVGGNTVEVAAHQGQIIVEDIRRMLAGERPRRVLNPETLAGFSWTGPRRAVDAAALETLAGQAGPAVSDLQQGPAPESVPGPAAAQVELPGREVMQEAGKMEGKPAGGEVKAQVERVLGDFLERARADPALNAFAAKHHVTTHYTLSDLGLEFYVGFEGGKVVAGLGAPPEQAPVRMKASAATLDSILTGQVSGNKAAMSGKLSFSGDVRLAMSQQRIQGDLIRLYSAAREQAGGLDAAALARAGLPPSLGAAPAVLEPSRDPREEMVQLLEELYTLQLITATGGNISARIPGKAEAWMTPSQLFKGNLRPEVMVRVDMEGNALDPAALSPSSERQLHTEIYKARPEVQAVIHTHAPYITILGLSGRPFLPVTTDAAFFKELPRVPFIMPGTRELALAVVEAMGRNPAAIMQNHGLVVAAGSLRQAANLTEAIERTAQLILGCYAAGKKPPTLPKDIVQTLREVGEMMA